MNSLEYANGGIGDSYRNKLWGIVAALGAPTIRVTAEGSYTTGVVYAKVGDFGAGHDSMMVVYLAHAMPNVVPIEDVACSYEVEIWDTLSEGGVESKLDRVYAGLLHVCEQGNVLADVRLIGLDGRWCIVQREKRDDGTYEASHYYGLSANGGYGETEAPFDVYHADEVCVPVASSDASGYGLENGLLQSDSELWQLGVAKPAVSLVELPIRSGWYLATLSIDGFNSNNMNTGYVTKAAIDSGMLKASGTLEHADRYEELFERGHKRDIVGPMEWAFPLGDSVVFQLRGGSDGPHEVDASRFAEALGYQGLGLVIEVAEGVVVLAAISS